MESIPDSLIHVSQEDKEAILEMCNVDSEDRIKEAYDAVNLWCQKQDHFVEKNINRNMLERLVLLAQGSVEGTKKRLDCYLTSRGMMPEIMLNREVDEFNCFYDLVNYVPLPKLHPLDRSRVHITQFLTDKLDDWELLSYFRFNFMVGEYRIHFDYTIAERYVVDLKNLNLSHLAKINPIVVRKAEVLCTEGCGTKIKGIHIVNAPPFVDKVVFILKQALKDKVAKRIHVHPTYDDLQKHIPKEVLPKDYGGDQPSVSKLAAQWRDELKTERARKILKGLDRLVTDESRRQSTKFNEEYLGMPGSFRTLSVD